MKKEILMLVALSVPFTGVAGAQVQANSQSVIVSQPASTQENPAVDSTTAALPAPTTEQEAVGAPEEIRGLTKIIIKNAPKVIEKVEKTGKKIGDELKNAKENAGEVVKGIVKSFAESAAYDAITDTIFGEDEN